MAKYMVLWEVDINRLSIDPKERIGWYNQAHDMVEDDLKNGTVDWGEFPGSHKGYSIWEGVNEEELELRMLRYIPYVKMEVHPVLSISQMKKAVKDLAQK
ncbi:MAG: hypothetical protein MOIL_01103 [Candidatus Methanolliviera sp. GoM_oil]|nr:MAG: hypothetical protein MOIL_01103 [Candidatus Methanolliviera sp. GoM_oil]